MGGRPKNLPGPIGLCIVPLDRVWVGATSNRVQQFTSVGKYLRGFGTTGTSHGEIHTPHGLALDLALQNPLYVTPMRGGGQAGNWVDAIEGRSRYN